MVVHQHTGMAADGDDFEPEALDWGEQGLDDHNRMQVEEPERMALLTGLLTDSSPGQQGATTAQVHHHHHHPQQNERDSIPPPLPRAPSSGGRSSATTTSNNGGGTAKTAAVSAGSASATTINATATTSATSKKKSPPKKSTTRTPARKISRKKAKNFPKRPLSAYNLYFQQQRLAILKESTETISFEEMGKIIGERWRHISPEDRTKYSQLARKDHVRYNKELQVFEDKRRNRIMQRISDSPPTVKSAPVPESREAGASPSEHNGGDPRSLPSDWMPPCDDDQQDPRQTPTQGGFPHIITGSASPQETPRTSNVGGAGSKSSSIFRPYKSSPGGSPSSRNGASRRLVRPSVTPTTPSPNSAAHHHGIPAAASVAEARSDALPAGTVVYLPDHEGVERAYRVEYKYYRMTRTQAYEYIRHWEHESGRVMQPQHQQHYGHGHGHD